MLNLLVHDPCVRRHYSIRMRNFASLTDVLDWVRRVKVMPGNHLKTALAVYDERFPPHKARLAK